MNDFHHLPTHQNMGSARDDNEDEIDIGRLLAILDAGKSKIVGVVVAALLCAIFYLFVTHPVYRADVLLEIQSKDSSPLAGVTSELQQFTGQNSSIAAPEMQIIKSRSVLGQAVEKLHLETIASPHYFPIIGNAIARRRKPGMPAATAVPVDQGSWLSHYAWSPVSLTVTRFSVPDELANASFTLRALGGDRFVLLAPDGTRILQGQVGKAAEGQTDDGLVQIFVQSLIVSAPPTDFTVAHRPWLAAVGALSDKLNVAEQGRDTGIVQMTLEGTDRARVKRVLNFVANNYLQQNVEARSKQAQKSLEFLETQLPELKADVSAAESKLTAYKENNDQPVDLDKEGQALLDQGVALQNEESQLQMKLTELRQTYTGDHPTLEAAREQMQQLKQRRQALEKKIGTLPNAEKAILRLRRDVEVKTQLYVELLNRTQELRVVKAGTTGNVRIIDAAVRPLNAVSPNSKLVLLAALVLGGILGCGLVFLQSAMRRGINDPKEIETKLGLSVYAIIPFSSWLLRQSRRATRHNQPAPILARDHGDDVAVEALRSLRTSLYFAQMETDSNIILMTGPAPGVGKSFVSANFAYLLSESGQRVVIVDADMRKGRLHEFMEGRQREPGLSQVLTGQTPLVDALREIEGTNIKVLTSGKLPPNPSELLMRKAFPGLLKQLKQDYDLVLIDAPPVLAVTDAAVISAAMPGIVTFMVARAGAHPIGELEESVKRMSQHDRTVAGVVFNAFRPSHAKNAGGYSYYHYEYKAHA